MKLSIIVPCFNEKYTIEILITKLINLSDLDNKEIIIVDDGSTDGSKDIIKERLESKVTRVIYHKNNMGKGSAINSAKKVASGDFIVIQDADLEYDPEDLIKMFNYVKSNNNYKVIYGSRVLNKNRYSENKEFINIYRVFFNHALTIFSNLLNNQKLTDAHTCYKMFSKDIFNKIDLKEKGFAFCPEVNTKISKLNEAIHEIAINYNGREYDEGKKISAFDGIRAIYAILKYRYFVK